MYMYMYTYIHVAPPIFRNPGPIGEDFPRNNTFLLDYYITSIVCLQFTGLYSKYYRFKNIVIFWILFRYWQYKLNCNPICGLSILISTSIFLHYFRRGEKAKQVSTSLNSQWRQPANGKELSVCEKIRYKKATAIAKCSSLHGLR